MVIPLVFVWPLMNKYAKGDAKRDGPLFPEIRTVPLLRVYFLKLGPSPFSASSISSSACRIQKRPVSGIFSLAQLRGIRYHIALIV